jgi:hypothetical protein
MCEILGISNPIHKHSSIFKFGLYNKDKLNLGNIQKEDMVKIQEEPLIKNVEDNSLVQNIQEEEKLSPTLEKTISNQLQNKIIDKLSPPFTQKQIEGKESTGEGLDG